MKIKTTEKPVTMVRYIEPKHLARVQVTVLSMQVINLHINYVPVTLIPEP